MRHKQTIPKIEVPYRAKTNTLFHEKEKYPTLDAMTQSDNDVERYWVTECLKKLKELGKDNDVYLSRLEEEADIKRTISEKLETKVNETIKEKSVVKVGPVKIKRNNVKKSKSNDGVVDISEIVVS